MTTVFRHVQFTKKEQFNNHAPLVASEATQLEQNTSSTTVFPQARVSVGIIKLSEINRP